MKTYMLELDKHQIEFLLRFHGEGSSPTWTSAISRFMESNSIDGESMIQYMTSIAKNSETNSYNLYKKNS